MSWATALLIGQIVIGGGVLTALLLHWREHPKARAEAKRITEEAEGAEWGRFQKEIGRLEERLSRVERENEALRERLDRQRGRERTLEHENGLLRQQVEQLETRLAALENLFKSQPLSPEMEEALARLDKTAPRERVAK